MKQKLILIILAVGAIMSVAIVSVLSATVETVKQEFYTTNLFDAKMNLPDELTYVNRILDPIDLECYAVAWYNPDETGQAIVFMESFEKINQSMPSNQTAFKFLENSLVRKYLEVNCLLLTESYSYPKAGLVLDTDSLGITSYLAGMISDTV